jgi:hypothetical protein
MTPEESAAKQFAPGTMHIQVQETASDPVTLNDVDAIGGGIWPGWLLSRKFCCATPRAV